MKLTGEEEAPLLCERKEGKGAVVKEWSEEVKEQMREMRGMGMSRLAIAQR